MSIDWLEAESAIDKRLDLAARRTPLQEALAKNPADPAISLELLELLDQLEVDPASKLRVCAPAVEANPDNASLLAWSGQISMLLGVGEVAMKALKRSQALDPSEPLANFTLGQLALGRGEFDKALEAVIRCREKGAELYYTEEIDRLYCIILARLGRGEEAYELQAEVLNRDPDNTQAIIDTADLLELMGRRKESEALLKSALKSNPDDTSLLFRFAVASLEADDPGRCEVYCDRVLDLNAQHLEAWNLRAQARHNLGNFLGALDDHEMIRELSKSIPLDQTFRARCLLGLARRDEAIAALKQGISDSEAYPQIEQACRQMLDRLTVVTPDAPGRRKMAPNERCWCGSGKKFKKCHGAAR